MQQPPNDASWQPQPAWMPQQGYPQSSQPQGKQWHTPQPPSLPPSPQHLYPPPPFQQPPQGYPAPQQPYPYPYPYQQPYPYPYPYPQMAPQPVQQVNSIVTVTVQQKGPGFLVRALYFVFVGCWLGYLWLNIGFALCALIVTLPLGLAMLNRLPQVLTLRAQGQQTNVQVATAVTVGSVIQTVNVTSGGIPQYSMLVRILYFLLVGWWAGYIWANIGYFLCVIVIGLPLGLMMLNRLPMVLTLRKN